VDVSFASFLCAKEKEGEMFLFFAPKKKRIKKGCFFAPKKRCG
jgi:hypothetical protein